MGTFHDTSSPKYPEGDGLAEASVRIIKKLRKKAASNEAQVTEKCNTLKSLKVYTEDGRVLLRNRRDLPKTRELFPVPRATSDFHDHDENTSSSKVSPPTLASNNVAPPSQAANSEIQDGAVRQYHKRSGREARPPKDYTI